MRSFILAASLAVLCGCQEAPNKANAPDLFAAIQNTADSSVAVGREQVQALNEIGAQLDAVATSAQVAALQDQFTADRQASNADRDLIADKLGVIVTMLNEVPDVRSGPSSPTVLPDGGDEPPPQAAAPRAADSDEPAPSNVATLLLFVGPNCAYCPAQEALVPSLTEAGERVLVVHLPDPADAERSIRLSARYGVNMIPCWIRVNPDGSEVSRVPLKGADRYTPSQLHAVLYPTLQDSARAAPQVDPNEPVPLTEAEFAQLQADLKAGREPKIPPSQYAPQPIVNQPKPPVYIDRPVIYRRAAKRGR